MTYSNNKLRSVHYNQKYASQTRSWNGTDSQEEFEKNMGHYYRRLKLEELGWDKPDCITYKFNSLGFRDDEFDDRECGLSFGCSFTEGVGVDHGSSWPQVLSRITGLHFWNLGIGGASMDTVYRIFENFINELNPKVITLCCPLMYRFEYAESDSRMVSLLRSHIDLENPAFRPFFKHYFSFDFNSEINFEKNLRALSHIAQEKNIPFFHASLKPDRLARDLLHPGRDCQKIFAETIANMIENKY